MKTNQQLSTPSIQPSAFGQVFDKLTEDITSCGFEGVLYSFFPRYLYLNEKVQPILHYSDALAPFVDHYLQNNFGNHDFVLRMALEQKTKKPIDWWEEIRAGNVSPEEQKVTNTAKRKFGIHHGLSIPALSGTFAIAGISAVSKNEDLKHFKQLRESCEEKLFKLAAEYHSQMMRSHEEVRFFLTPLLERLNTTQKKVLKHLLSSKPMKAIPDTYQGLSPKYAEKVLYNLRIEFGGISTPELCYLLGMAHAHEYL